LPACSQIGSAGLGKSITVNTAGDMATLPATLTVIWGAVNLQQFGFAPLEAVAHFCAFPLQPCFLQQGISAVRAAGVFARIAHVAQPGQVLVTHMRAQMPVAAALRKSMILMLTNKANRKTVLTRISFDYNGPNHVLVPYRYGTRPF
jgi:hypothetical protein